jgi:hypothetical protein
VTDRHTMRHLRDADEQKDIGNAKSTKFSRISLELVEEVRAHDVGQDVHRVPQAPFHSVRPAKTFHKTSCRCGRITRKPWHFGVAVGIVSAAAHGAEVSVVLRSAGPGQVELKCATGTSPVSGTQAPSRSVPAAGTCQTHLLCRCICRRVTADLSHPPFTNK